MENVKRFYESAKEYCNFISENEITTETISDLMPLLMQLYTESLYLPTLEPETDNVPIGVNSVKAKISKEINSTYWEIYNPFILDDPVCGDLSDDFADIANDLMIGIAEYDLGLVGNAAFAWKDSFTTHWGRHVVNALRVLDEIRNNRL